MTEHTNNSPNTDRQTAGRTDRQMTDDRLTTDGPTDGPTDGRTDQPTDQTQTDRQTKWAVESRARD